jgi:SHS family lactate transporter-like MFS transporter
MDEGKPRYEASPDVSPDVEEHMSIGRYIATRITTLVPPMNPAPNPFKALTLLNRTQWLNFTVCQSSRRARVEKRHG